MTLESRASRSIQMGRRIRNGDPLVDVKAWLVAAQDLLKDEDLGSVQERVLRELVTEVEQSADSATAAV